MIERLLRFAYRRRAAVLLAACVVFAVSAALVARITFDTNILRLLPQNGPAVRSFQTYLRQFGTFDHIYVLFEVPPGNRISDGEDLIDRYVEHLRASPEIVSVDAELFDEVKDWNYLLDRELLLLGPELVAGALARFRPAEMAAALVQSRSLLSVSSPQVKAYVQQDPLGLVPLLRDRLGRGRALVDFDPTQTGYVSKDGRSRLVMAKPSRPPFDTAFDKRLFARLAEVEKAARAETRAAIEPGSDERPPDVTVQVAGGYRIAIESERMIRREMLIQSLSSLGGLLLLILVVFRTFRILLYGTVPLVLAALVTLGVNGLGGPLSPAMSGGAAMLFGLGIDGVAIMYLRYREERTRGFAPEDAIGRTSGTAKSVMLAYTTTAATFGALLVVDFPSLQDLGRLVGLGILVCYALLLMLLPAMVGTGRSKRPERAITTPWLGRFVERRGRPILVAAAAATVVFGLAASRLHLDLSLERLQAHGESEALERQVADRFALPHDVVLALGRGPDLQPLLESANRLGAAVEREAPAVIVSSPDIVLPPGSEQEQVSEVVRTAGLDPGRVRADFEREAAAAGFRPGTFQPFLDRLGRLLDPSTRITYQGLVDHHLDTLTSRYVVQDGGDFLVAVYLYPKTAADVDRVARLAARAAPSFQLTGVPFVNRELEARFFPQFTKGILVGIVAVALLMYVGLRRVGDALLAFVPTVLGFVWSAGLLALARVDVDLFSLFGATTFIGIATDYAAYVIYRFHVEGTRPMREVLTQTGAGVLVACGTTLIGFGSLISSSYGPLRSFGIASVATIGSCLIAALLVLPAWLQETDRS